MLKSFIRNLSAPAEFCLVILVGFGLPFLTTIVERVIGHLMHAPPRPVHFNDFTLIWLFFYELLAMTVVFWIGRVRGWSFTMLGFQISWKWTGVGFLLYVFTTIAYELTFFLLVRIIPLESSTASFSTDGLTLPVIILSSITNPFFEEMLEVGYLIRRLQGFGIWPAVLASALLRSVLHIHLGGSGMASVFVMGVIFGLVYWRWQQLWPLIVAHALMDLIGLLYLVHYTA